MIRSIRTLAVAAMITAPIACEGIVGLDDPFRFGEPEAGSSAGGGTSGDAATDAQLDAPTSSCLGPPFQDPFTSGPAPTLWEPLTSLDGIDYNPTAGLRLTLRDGEVGQTTLRSKTAMDLRQKRVWLKVLDPPSTATATALFQWEDLGLEGATFRLESGIFRGDFMKTPVFANTVYDPKQHAYLQLRHDGVQLHFETSADGVKFVSQGSTATGQFGLDAAYVQITVGRTAAGPADLIGFDAVGGSACQ